MATEDHIDLWKKFKAGDWGAYTSLYNIFFAQLNNYGVKFSADTTLIEDAVHDLYVKLWTSRANLGDPVSVKNYLYKSFRNILFRKMKTQDRFTRLDHTDEPDQFSVAFSSAQMNMENKDLRNQLISIIKELAPRQQEIVFLRYYEGFTYEEIAEIMGIELSSAYKLLYKALDSLHKILGPGSLILMISLYADYIFFQGRG
jgi:RNA polymerase sigma factor (sigma-70 family)